MKLSKELKERLNEIFSELDTKREKEFSLFNNLKNNLDKLTEIGFKIKIDISYEI